MPPLKLKKRTVSLLSAVTFGVIIIPRHPPAFILVSRFKDRATERVFHGLVVRRLPPDIQRRARMRLQRVFAATALSDLRVPPSHRLKALHGDRTGQHSIRVNDQWRICFVWTEQGAMAIEVTDYH